MKADLSKDLGNHLAALTLEKKSSKTKTNESRGTGLEGKGNLGAEVHGGALGL